MTEQKNMKTGTTTVGVLAEDAAILAADTKATMGNLISNKTTRKIFPLSDNMGMTTAGLVGDAQFLTRLMKAEIKLYELQRGTMSVKAGASLLANVCFNGKGYFPYYVQLLVGGYDTKPHLYSIDAAGGSSEEEDYFSTGSGSPFALGVLEDAYEKDLPKEEALKVAVRAVHAATQRDTASGGKRIMAIIFDEKGYTEVSEEEIDKILEESTIKTKK